MTAHIDPYAPDLAALCRRLAPTIRRLPGAYVPGKTALRDTLMAEDDLPATTAEQLVDTLEMRGYLRFERTPTAPPRWRAIPRAR